MWKDQGFMQNMEVTGGGGGNERGPVTHNRHGYDGRDYNTTSWWQAAVTQLSHAPVNTQTTRRRGDNAWQHMSPNATVR